MSSETEESQSTESPESTEDTKERAQSTATPWAASLGGWMSNVSGYATTITEKLKTAVKSNSLVNDFQEEQHKFEREKQRVKDTAVPPWVGYNEEEKMKAQILELSADSRNVLRQPPPGVQFHFEFNKSFPVAQSILKEDKRLQQLRFDLVPKKITEVTFWHNYFYRVFLVKQSSQLSSLAAGGHSTTTQATEEPDDSSTVVEEPSLSNNTTTGEPVEIALEDAMCRMSAVSTHSSVHPDKDPAVSHYHRAKFAVFREMYNDQIKYKKLMTDSVVS